MLATVTAALLLLLVSQATAAESGSHCAATEQTLFSCSTGRKVVSVCGTPDLSATSGFVQYRFGTVGSPELIYPPTSADWREVTRAGVLTFGGGGGAYLAFLKTPYRYFVYTAIGRGWGSKAGVVVEKNGKRIDRLRCKEKETSELGPDLFSQSGISEDTVGFEVP